MLTGQLPLNAEDYDGGFMLMFPKIKAPDKINPDIPSAISDIILKLLSKTVDERYQTAQGLLRDLEECRRQLNISGKIEPFFLGQADVYNCFKIPSRLFGREVEAKP